jgi:hypothetical protein
MPDVTGTWIHVFEEDTPEGAVYRREDADIPLSRRPRERLELKADGSAELLMPGPNDAYVPQPARWTDQDDDVVVRAARGGVTLRVVERASDRLVIRRS